jgi:L,D-peptidoglycan transpeptidase YkuD (ErfK/YbiS/YcfS/YnhG family)
VETVRSKWLPITLAVVLVLALLWGINDDSPAEAATPPTPAQIQPSLVGDAQQLVVVTTSGWKETYATVVLYEKRGNTWHRVSGLLGARIGRNGFNASHREGDGTSPAGSFRLLSAFGRPANPGTLMQYRQLQPGDCWISDVQSPLYNRWVSRSPCAAPNEDLYRISSGAYKYAVVTDYNWTKTVKGAGSAIFLHRHSYTASNVSKPTSGCVSLRESDLLAVLRWLNPAKRPRIVMGPASWLTAKPAAAAAPPAAKPATWTTLSYGSRGDGVKKVQQVLVKSGIPTVVDGIFGTQTRRNVMAYQRAKHLYVDGIVGKQTAHAMGLH